MAEPTREDLYDAAMSALHRLMKAEDAYRVGGRKVWLLRELQIAQDEHRNLMAELREYDDARDVRVVYQADKHPPGRRR